MNIRTRNAGNLELVGGDLCLDFTNTVNTRIAALRHEYLVCYEDLVSWSQHAGILTNQDAKNLRQLATERPAEATAVLSRALAMREVIYRIFSAVANRREPLPSDLIALNTAIAEILRRQRIAIAKEGGFRWEWDLDPHAMDLMLWPIIRSAADLLTRPDIAKIRQCARRGCCDWLFIDTSKNQSRRWCSMDLCGSRDKVQRYYHRKRGGVRFHT